LTIYFATKQNFQCNTNINGGTATLHSPKWLYTVHHETCAIHELLSGLAPTSISLTSGARLLQYHQTLTVKNLQSQSHDECGNSVTAIDSC